jgi:hypothetical protein
MASHDALRMLGIDFPFSSLSNARIAQMDIRLISRART